MDPDQADQTAQDAILPVWLLLALIAMDMWHINRPPGMREPPEPWMFPLYCGPYLATAITTAWPRTRPFGLGVALGGSFIVSLIGVPLMPLMWLGAGFDGPDANWPGFALVPLHMVLMLVSLSLYRKTVTQTARQTAGAVGLITGAMAMVVVALRLLSRSR